MIYNLKYVNDDGKTIDFSLASKIVISSATGFTENFIELSMSQGVNQIGATVQGEAVQAKDITINGEILGKTIAARRLLVDTIKPLMGGRLIYNNEWEIRVVPMQTPIVEKNLVNAKFQFILKAPYPYWNKVQETATILAGIQPMFKFPWDLSKPFSFGMRIASYFTNVVNEGNVEAPFTAVFTASGEVQNPHITNAATYQYLKLLKTMQVGEVITVTSSATGLSIISEYQGVRTDVFGRLDIYSDLYRLNVGDNVIRYDADVNRDGLEVTIYHNTVNVGVYN